MKQLRDAPATPLGPAILQDAKVDVGPVDRSPIVLFGLMFCAAVVAGWAARFVIFPPPYLVMVIMAAGGASAAFLAFAIPTHTLLFIRRLVIRGGLVFKRSHLRTVLDDTHAMLLEQVKHNASADGLGDLAVVEYLRGTSETAERDLARALEMDPENPALLNNLGVVLAEEARYGKAAELFSRAVRASADSEARTNLGLVAALAEDPEPFAQLVPANPEAQDAMALNNLGVFHLKRGNLDLAGEWFAQAVRQDSRYAYAWANLGLVSYRRARLREATTHLIKAARSAPTDARIANNLGVVLAAVDKPAWSHEQLARARALEPTNIGIRINELAVEAFEGRLEIALRGLRPLAAAAFHRGEACYNLAVVSMAVNDLEGAAASAAEAIEHGEASADAYSNLGVALWRLGRHAEALSHFAASVHAADVGPRAASNLARALMLDEDNCERALGVLEAARAAHPDDTDLALDLATAMLYASVSRYRRDMNAAERRDFFVELHRSYGGLEAATRRAKHVPVEAHVNMGLYFYLREDYLHAIEHFERAVEIAPGVAALHHLAGTAYGVAADRQRHLLEDGTRSLTQQGLDYIRKAVPHFEKACEPRDAATDSFYNLGRSLYALGEYERALEVSRKALRIEDSDEMNALAALAAAQQARQWQEAVKTQSLMPEGRKLVLTKRARQFLDAAVQYFRQALLHNELSPTLHGNMGLAYMLRNQEHDVESALRHWQRMKAIAGAEVGRRYTDFTQIQTLEHAARIQFDDSEAACREIEVRQWVCAQPPQPAGLHYVLEPAAEGHEWRLITANPRLRRALHLRDLIADGKAALARLEL